MVGAIIERMLISREELRFDFRGACFDVASARERALLGWVFNQFLYGEVTGIQCGHWLYRAPHLGAATFLARQAVEELSHVKRILRILQILDQQPARPHPAIRFLSTGMMGGSWGEHVAIEMALGEGLVLSVFYAMAETIDQPEIRKILESSLADEEKHVDFGEKETRDWLRAHPSDRLLLLGQALVQALALRWIQRFVVRRLTRLVGERHPVLSSFGGFYEHVVHMFELRVERLGLSDRPLREMGLMRKTFVLGALPFMKLRAFLFSGRRKLLTETYLSDPWVVRPPDSP